MLLRCGSSLVNAASAATTTSAGFGAVGDGAGVASILLQRNAAALRARLYATSSSSSSAKNVDDGPKIPSLSLEFPKLKELYLGGKSTPSEVVSEIERRIVAAGQVRSNIIIKLNKTTTFVNLIRMSSSLLFC